MDYAHPQNVDGYGGEERHYQQGEEDEEFDEGNQGEQEYYSERARGGGGVGGGDMIGQMDSLDDSTIAVNNLKHSGEESSAGKLFVGGIAWETSEETFSRYFGKYGEITDSVIMMDKISGRPRGFGFVTFADPEVANKVLEEEHIIDGRTVEVKRTVPREDMHGRVVSRTRKVFVGGIPVSLTEEDLKEYFSTYGNIVEYQIMLDHKTGRSRGFGFVTFDSEDAVEKIFSDGQMHELGGKRVEIKKAEPKRPGADHISDNRVRRGGGVGGGNSKSYGDYSGGTESFGGGYGGKMGRGYVGAYGGYAGYGAYGNYGGNFGGNPGLYGYGGYGYGFGFGGPMYGNAGYGGGGGGYIAPGGYGGVAGGYGSGRGYGSGKSYAAGPGGAAGYSGGGGGGKGYGGGGVGGGGGGGAYGGKGYGNAGGGVSNGRFHPYRK